MLDFSATVGDLPNEALFVLMRRRHCELLLVNSTG